MELTADIVADEDRFLELEACASQPYTDFVFTTAEQAARVRTYLFQRGLSEFSPPYGRLLRDGGRTVGMLAVLTGAELSRCRLKAGMTLAKSQFLQEDPHLGPRLQLAGQTLLKVLPDDFYISRIATVQHERGRGVGSHLLRQAETEAIARACPRIVLEVSPRSTAALHLYQSGGFRQIDSRRVTDPRSGRSLEYLHLSKLLT